MTGILGLLIGVITLGIGMVHRDEVTNIWTPSMPAVYIGAALMSIGVMALIAWVAVAAVDQSIAGLQRDLRGARKALKRAAKEGA